MITIWMYALSSMSTTKWATSLATFSTAISSTIPITSTVYWEGGRIVLPLLCFQSGFSWALALPWLLPWTATRLYGDTLPTYQPIICIIIVVIILIIVNHHCQMPTLEMMIMHRNGDTDRIELTRCDTIPDICQLSKCEKVPNERKKYIVCPQQFWAGKFGENCFESKNDKCQVWVTDRR